MSDVYAPSKDRITAAEFERMPSPSGLRQELVAGEVMSMPPPGFEHGVIAGKVLRMLANHVESHQLGLVCAAETGFRLSEDTVRAADVAFVATARVPGGRVTGYLAGAPDLAVEVRSPSDSLASVMDKLKDWLEHGSREAWLVDPESRSVTVYSTGDHPIRVFHADATIETGEWLGSFRLKLADIFPDYVEPEATKAD